MTNGGLTTSVLKDDQELAARAQMDGINWTIVSTILLWIAAAFGTLTGLYFNSKLENLKVQIDEKLDHENASELIDKAIDRYHERIVEDLKKESNEKHKVNTTKLDRIYELLLTDRLRGGSLP